MQLTCTQRQGKGKEHIGTWKLLQAVHKELLCNYNPSTRAAQEISPFQVD